MVLVVMMVPVVWMAMQPASGDSVVVAVGAVGGAKMTLIKAIFFCSGRHRSLASIDNCLDTTVSTQLLFSTTVLADTVLSSFTTIADLVWSHVF